jgi:hypothetical protein
MHCRHIDGDKHIELHDPIVVGFCADGEDASLSMAFTNVWMMLNYFRVLNSGWPMQLMGDGTFNFADRDIAMLGMGVMTPGGKLRPLIFSYVPTESAEAYKFCWMAFERSAISFVNKFQPCDVEECTTCQSILAVLKNEMTVEAGKTNMFQRQKRLAVDVATSDNSAAFKKFAVENLGISSMKCAAHLTGTNKNLFYGKIH